VELREKYELTVGLEVHIQLNTKTKLFSSDTTLFGQEANTQTNEVSLAHPGALPVLNAKALDKAIKMGLACNSIITKEFYFDRKHYFYPDSPFGYQITQQNTPICLGGYVSVPNEQDEKEVALEKIHMEADAGKSIHDLDVSKSYVDLNRAGMPLLELVTKPVIEDIDEVGRFVQEIQRLVRFLEIGDGNMEEGSLRCDANISVRLRGEKELGQKVEIKNMNSVRHIKKALEYEFGRQSNLLEKGKKILQETRLFDVDKVITEGMRDKEEAHDYRYFPDPDLAPVHISEERLTRVKENMPVLPMALRKLFIEDYAIARGEALSLAGDKLISTILVDTVEAGIVPTEAAKWVIGPFKGLYNQMESEALKIDGQRLASLISLVLEGRVTYRNAVDVVLPEMAKAGKEPRRLIADLGLAVESNEDELGSIIQVVLDNHPKEVQAYKNGKKALLQLFMGKVMRETKGKADPRTTMKLIKEILS
jgi:aspartyl-tRNA(Asn)/glutamyl-tRNA(Gln) amidotransferase subunit B